MKTTLSPVKNGLKGPILREILNTSKVRDMH